MLTLLIKKKWFDMILSGEKKEEYREIKSYWTKRFINLCGLGDKPNCNENIFVQLLMLRTNMCADGYLFVSFRNGYNKNSPSFIAKCTLSVGTGKEEWGAEKDKEYFILTVQEILKGSED